MTGPDDGGLRRSMSQVALALVLGGGAVLVLIVGAVWLAEHNLNPKVQACRDAGGIWLRQEQACAARLKP